MDRRPDADNLLEWIQEQLLPPTWTGAPDPVVSAVLEAIAVYQDSIDVMFWLDGWYTTDKVSRREFLARMDGHGSADLVRREPAVVSLSFDTDEELQQWLRTRPEPEDGVEDDVEDDD